MRPWIIVLSSTIIALAVAAAIAVPETLDVPPSEIVADPAAAFAGRWRLSAGGLRAFRNADGRRASLACREPVRARHGLGPATSTLRRRRHRRERVAPTMTEWLARFAPSEARAEFARSHYILLARSHVFSALIVLAGIIGLGLAQDHGSLPFSWGTVPTISAILVLVGVLLLTLLGRIAIDVTVEPLLEAILAGPRRARSHPIRCGAPWNRWRRACEAIRSGERAPTRRRQLPDRLVTVLDARQPRPARRRRPLVGEHRKPSEASIHSSAQTIETAVRSAAAQQRPADHMSAERRARQLCGAAGRDRTAHGLLRRLVAVPAGSSRTGLAPGPVPARREPSPPRLAGELRRLLQEIDAS